MSENRLLQPKAPRQSPFNCSLIRTDAELQSNVKILCKYAEESADFLETVPTHQDLINTVKRVRKYIDERDQQTHDALLMRLGKLLDKAIEPYQEQIKDLQQHIKGLESQLDQVQPSMDVSLNKSLRSTHFNLVQEMKSLAKELRDAARKDKDELIAREKTLIETMKSLLVEAVKRLPAPQVAVSVPEKAIRVDPAQVILSQPKRTRKKRISYAEDGRPLEIVESEEDAEPGNWQPDQPFSKNQQNGE